MEKYKYIYIYIYTHMHMHMCLLACPWLTGSPNLWHPPATHQEALGLPRARELVAPLKQGAAALRSGAVGTPKP